MKKVQLRVDVKKGKLVIDGEQFKDLVSLLEDGRYTLIVEKQFEPNTLFDYRKHYFALRDNLHVYGDTGLSINEIHKLAKQHIFPRIPNEEKYFDVTEVDIEDLRNIDKWSVTWLTLEGMKLYVKHFKAFAWEHYNCYL